MTPYRDKIRLMVDAISTWKGHNILENYSRIVRSVLVSTPVARNILIY